MSSSKPDNYVLISKCNDVKVLRRLALELYEALDDIDTLGDMLKPEIDAYFKQVQVHHRRRHRFSWTDGHGVFVEREFQR